MTKIEARAKVKNHLKRHGNTELNINERMVRRWWDVLNKAVFDGKLTPPRKVLTRKFHGGDLGWCLPRDKSKYVEMGIRSDLPTKEVFMTVLVHEMVHQAEWEQQQHIAHGPFFYGWRDKVKERTGLHLSRLVDADY